MPDNDELIPTELVRKQAQMLADKTVREEFIKAIEDQIKTADPKGIEPLVTYIGNVQKAGIGATERLVALVKEQAGASKSLTKTEKAVLEYWSEDRSGTVERAMAKFRDGLEREKDKAVVNAWLSELTERERSLVTTGAIVGRDLDAGLFLAVNLYRARLSGLSDEKLLAALRICQIYCGLPAYVAAAHTLVEVGTVLKEMPDDSRPAEVIERLLKRFDFSL